MVRPILELVILAVTEVLVEGRVDDARKAFRGSDELFSVLVKEQPPGSNNKYLMWCVRAINAMKDPDVDACETICGIASDFDEVKDLMPKKDIYAYDPEDPYLNNIMDWTQRAREKKEQKKVEAVKKDEYVKVYDDGRYLVIRPLTTAASCKYGANTQWCISAKNDNMFDEYSESNIGFYMIIDRERSLGDPMAKVALSVNSGKIMAAHNAIDDDVLSSSFDSLADTKEIYGNAWESMWDAISDFDASAGETVQARNKRGAWNKMIGEKKHRIAQQVELGWDVMMGRSMDDIDQVERAVAVLEMMEEGDPAPGPCFLDTVGKNATSEMIEVFKELVKGLDFRVFRSLRENNPHMEYLLQVVRNDYFNWLKAHNDVSTPFPK